MKVTKITKGHYKVELAGVIAIIKDMSNPDLCGDPHKGWVAWFPDETLECKDVNCGASTDPNKMTMLKCNQEDYDKRVGVFDYLSK